MTKKTLDFNSVRTAINEELNKILTLPDDLTARVVEAMRYSAISEGKAFRPFLILTVGKMLNCPGPAILSTAAAVEMIHTYSLIHDDLPPMDNDSMRRGKPSNHIRFDEATALLAGDALLTKGFEVLSGLNIPPLRRCRLIAALSRAVGAQGMIGGQMIDLTGEKKRLTLAEITQMQAFKTGALISFSCTAPCYITGCSSSKQAALSLYGSAIGQLFQITDDLLDCYGDSKKAGKTLGKDEKSHKSTLLALTGEEQVRKHMNELAGTARRALKIFGEKANTLDLLIDFILTREK